MLINCGGTLDIIELLEPDEDVTFFVVDSHRPTDICNIYSSSQVFNLLFNTYFYSKYNSELYVAFQVRVLTPPDDDEKIPDFDDIFNDNEVIFTNNHNSFVYCKNYLLARFY